MTQPEATGRGEQRRRDRRLAREFLEIAHTLSVGEQRTILLQMAQVWQRLADQQRTAAQEKQQVQRADTKRPRGATAGAVGVP